MQPKAPTRRAQRRGGGSSLRRVTRFLSVLLLLAFVHGGTSWTVPAVGGEVSTTTEGERATRLRPERVRATSWRLTRSPEAAWAADASNAVVTRIVPFTSVSSSLTQSMPLHSSQLGASPPNETVPAAHGSHRTTARAAPPEPATATSLGLQNGVYVTAC